jgi:Domain of unknown function (DUF4375)
MGKFFSGIATGAMNDFIALDGEFRRDSLIMALCAALRSQSDDEARDLSPEETTVVAVNSLEEAVNSGGYAEFITQSPDQVGVIVQCLIEIGEKDVAELTARALAVPGVAKFMKTLTRPGADLSDTARNALEQIDEIYYERQFAMEDKLWDFVVSHHQAFTLPPIPTTLAEKPRGFFSRLFRRD